jgi:hypothetical protein
MPRERHSNLLAFQCPLQKNKRRATWKESCRKHNKKEKERARNLEEELAALKAEKKNREKEPTTRTPSTTGYNPSAATNSQVGIPFTPQQKMLRHDATNTCCTSKDVSLLCGRKDDWTTSGLTWWRAQLYLIVPSDASVMVRYTKCVHLFSISFTFDTSSTWRFLWKQQWTM